MRQVLAALPALAAPTLSNMKSPELAIYHLSVLLKLYIYGYPIGFSRAASLTASQGTMSR